MATQDTRKLISVTMISDLICPWCYIALHNLNKGIALVEDKFRVEVSLAPFLLKPNTPPEGADKPAVAPGKSRVSEALKTAGEAVGIDFTGKAERYPYTVTAHALLELAERTGKAIELYETLFKVYFTDGEYLDVDRLVHYGTQVGLDPEECRRVMTDTKTLEDTASRAHAWRTKDVTGIPCFYMNGVKTISGSDTPDHFAKMFDVVAQNYT